MKSLYLVIICIFWHGIACADTITLSAEKEAQAKVLFSSLHCMVCHGQSLADSDADLAVDMRGIIRQKLQNGETPEAITHFLTQRYGDAILMQPPFSLANALLWLAPLTMLIVAGAWLARHMFRTPPPENSPS